MISDVEALLARKLTIREKISLIRIELTDYGNSRIIRDILYDLLSELEKLKQKEEEKKE